MAIETVDLTQYSSVIRPFRWGQKGTPAQLAGRTDRYPGARMNMSFVIGQRIDDGTFDLIHHKNSDGLITEWTWTTTELTIRSGADII